MKLKIVINGVPLEDGGGLVAEVPALPGCTARADNHQELMTSVSESVQAWLEAAEDLNGVEGEQIVEISL